MVYAGCGALPQALCCRVWSESLTGQSVTALYPRGRGG
ncbi:hypothetical protein C4J84_3712 [Pseudomonas sp. R11-23-07]|nr:hypothetical protein C4J86_3868 [Pseudomonas sp. R2-7-07]AZF59571.1 hypothetical protein C4J84_3712 [Pseudomonas sp. R11-23-07]